MKYAKIAGICVVLLLGIAAPRSVSAAGDAIFIFDRGGSSKSESEQSGSGEGKKEIGTRRKARAKGGQAAEPDQRSDVKAGSRPSLRSTKSLEAEASAASEDARENEPLDSSKPPGH